MFFKLKHLQQLIRQFEPPWQTPFLEAPLQFSPLPHCLGQSFTLKHVGDYVRAIKALAPLALAPTSFKTINVLQALHPLIGLLVGFQTQFRFEIFLGFL